MSGLCDSAHFVRQWVEKAEDDLKVSTYLLTMGHECPYSAVCFHAQQCVEKYIKALLVYYGIDFPKIHDLTKLTRLVPAEMLIPLSDEEQDKLTDYATVDRYPGDREPITGAEAEEAVSIARRVREAIRSFLPPEVLTH
jgi:HEPN domain-containing protein